MQVTLGGVRMANGAVSGSMRLLLGTAPGSPIPIGDDQSGAVRRRTVLLSTEFPIDEDLRATTQALTVQTRITAAGGDVQVDALTWITLNVEFSEAPDGGGA
ncbi:hypothetical protein [Streptomyces sp. NPDC059491]|uniref:hypothetical protein n=1 Tax=Streptomyces sp. NPDC059491 TaxID=3346850 RepID=UPI0036B680DA